MKTKMNIRKLVSMGLILSAIFVFSTAGTLRANKCELQAAFERLENYSLAVEKSIRFSAPAVAEDIDALEVQAAIERLDNRNLTVEEKIRFKVSCAAEDIEVYELEVARERLEVLNIAIEQSIKFCAPSVLNGENTEEDMTFENNMNYALQVKAIDNGISIDMVK